MPRRKGLNYKSDRQRQRKKERQKRLNQKKKKIKLQTQTAINETPEIESEDEESHESDQASFDEEDDVNEESASGNPSPVRNHANLTKATRRSHPQLDLVSLQKEEEEKKKYLDELLKIRNVSTRQSFAIKNENLERSIKYGVLVHSNKKERLPFVSPKEGETETLILNVITTFMNLEPDDFKSGLAMFQVAPRISRTRKLATMVSRVLRVGETHVTRMIQLHDNFGEKYISGESLFSRPGPKVFSKEVSGDFTTTHLFVLCAYINSLTRNNMDRTTTQIAKYFQHLEPKGAPIKHLIAYLDSDVCFLKPEHKSLLRQHCLESPGPIIVSAQQTYRAIQAINDSDIFPDDFYFGDRTKLTSVGASTTESEEAKREAKIEYIAALKFIERLKAFNARDFVPDPGCKLNPSHSLIPFQCAYDTVFMDESWVTVGMRPNLTWICKHGEPQEAGRGSGIRFVLILFLSASGIHSWDDDEYGTNRDFFVHSTATDKSVKAHKKNIIEAMKKCGLIPHKTGERGLNQQQVDWEAFTKTFFGAGGAFAWQIDADAKIKSLTAEALEQSYKGNVNNETIVMVFLFQAWFAKRPTIFVIDNAPYHKNTNTYTPYKANVTKTETIAFLRSQPEDSELGKMWGEVATSQDKTNLSKDQLIEKVKALVPMTLNDLELALAEIGMKKFGVPHRVLFLPARMPEYNPVEFLWAWVKFHFKHNREAKLDKEGVPTGPMGVEQTRSVIMKTIGAITKERSIKMYRHVEKTVEAYYRSCPEIEARIDERLASKLEQCALAGAVKVATRSTSKPSPDSVQPFERARSTPSSSASTTTASAANSTGAKGTQPPPTPPVYGLRASAKSRKVET
jgi:hypothetical protein